MRIEARQACRKKVISPMISEVMTKRILVVDDDPGTRELLHRALTRAGYEVATASDAEEALCSFGAAGDFHAVISDVLLPGMDGKTMINRIHLRQPDIKAVLLSSFGGPVEYLEVTRTAGVDYLLKPINVDHLMAILEGSIGRPVEMPSDYWVN